MRTRTRSARHRTHGTLFGLCAALALAAAWPAYADIEITMPAFTLSHKVKWSRSGCAEGGLMFLEGAGGFAVRDVNLGGGFIGNPVGTRIADDELLLQYVLPRGKIFKTQAAVVSANTEPFALSGGETLTVRVDRGALQTITFAASDFATPGAATAAEVAARIAADLTGGLATANGGAVELRSATEGTASFIEVTGGSANAALGFPTAEAQGSENTVYAEYQYVYQPYLTRPPYVQLSTRIGYARTVIRTLAPVLGTFTAPVSGDITTGHDLILDDLHRVRVEIETTAPDIPLAYLSSIMRETVDGNLYCYTSGIGGSADPLYPASTDSANAGPFDLSAALPLTLTVRMNSAPEQTLTFTTADFADPAAATAAEIVAAINRQLVGGYASTIAYGTKVRLTSHSGAATSGIEVTGGGMNAFLGFTTAFVQGAPRTNPPDPTRVGIGHVYTTEIDPGTGAVTWRYVGYNYLIPGRDYRIGSGGMGFEDGVRAQYSGCYDYQDGVLLDGPGGNPITSTTLTAVPCGETQLYYRIEAPVPPPTGVIEASAELVPDAGDIAAGTGPRLSSWWAYFGRSPVDSSNPDYNTVMISRSGYTTVPAADGGLSPASVVFDGCMPEARYGFATARGSGGYPGLLGQGYGALLLDWPNDPSYPAFVTPIGPKYTSSVAFPANNDFAYITPLFDTPGINSPHGGVYPDGAIILHSDAPPPHTADSPKEIEQWHFRAEMAYLSGEVGLTGCVQTSEILMGTVHWLGVAGPSASYVDEAGVLRTYTTGNYGASGIGRM